MEVDAKVKLAIQDAGKAQADEFDVKLKVVHKDAHDRMDRMDEAASKSFETLTGKLDKISSNTNKILVSVMLVLLTAFLGLLSSVANTPATANPPPLSPVIALPAEPMHD